MYLATSFRRGVAEFFAARATHPVVWRVRLDGSRSCRHVNCLEPLTAVEHEVEFLFPPCV
jgi:hypothetical protein